MLARRLLIFFAALSLATLSVGCETKSDDGGAKAEGEPATEEGENTPEGEGEEAEAGEDEAAAGEGEGDSAEPGADEPAADADAPTRAVAVIRATEGNDTAGVITFEATPEGTKVSGTVTGLTPGKHGFHVHQFGDCSAADGTSAGGHFNPGGHDHAGPDAEMRHVGDLGNLEANEAGEATYDRVDAHLAFSGANSVIGRGLIVHADEDDMSSQPTGAAGARVGCAVIGIGKAAE